MTIRSFTLALFSGAAPAISPHSSREQQLAALTVYARHQLERAFHDGRHLAIRAAGRFLLDCHSLLHRVEERRAADAPSAAQSKLDRELEYERQAIIAMFEARPDIFETFGAFLEKVPRDPNGR